MGHWQPIILFGLIRLGFSEKIWPDEDKGPTTCKIKQVKRLLFQGLPIVSIIQVQFCAGEHLSLIFTPFLLLFQI